jgi:hypothetical protein
MRNPPRLASPGGRSFEANFRWCVTCQEIYPYARPYSNKFTVRFSA